MLLSLVLTINIFHYLLKFRQSAKQQIKPWCLAYADFRGINIFTMISFKLTV